MGESLNSSSSTGPELANVVNRKNSYVKSLVASAPKVFSRSGPVRQFVSPHHRKNVSASVGQLALFFVKLVALETVRRVSSCKCPHIWHGLQALQVICFPPFKWIQKWAPLRGLVNGIQMFSRPLLVLSVATAFSDATHSEKKALDGNVGSHVDEESHPEPLSEHPSHDRSFRSDDEALQIQASEKWMLRLYKELENQGISLPERINEDELRRFYSAANGDFSGMVLAIKRAVQWRKTYRILSPEELETWSSMIFWHGKDNNNYPCLIVRLGVAFACLPADQRPRFAQAVVSQVEHGILHLVDRDDPKITVIVDCHGISPLKIPMQVMRSCSSILQENFPDRLAYLLVIRLPPVVRVISQSIIRILQPVTRRKLRIEGNMYRRVLVEYIQNIPSFLGGDCTCKICSGTFVDTADEPESWNEKSKKGGNGYLGYGEDLRFQDLYHPAEDHVDINWAHLLRSTVIGILIVIVFIALVAGFYEDAGSSFPSP